MQIRKLFMVLLTLMLLCSVSVSVSASDHTSIDEQAVNDTVNPRWSMIISVTNSLEISSNGNANMSAYIAGHNGQVSSIQIVSTLQRYQSGSWVNVSSWTRNYNGSTAFWSASRYVNRGNYYRLTTHFTVYGNGTQESTILISPTKYY